MNLNENPKERDAAAESPVVTAVREEAVAVTNHVEEQLNDEAVRWLTEITHAITSNNIFHYTQREGLAYSHILDSIHLPPSDQDTKTKITAEVLYILLIDPNIQSGDIVSEETLDSLQGVLTDSGYAHDLKTYWYVNLPSIQATTTKSIASMTAGYAVDKVDPQTFSAVFHSGGSLTHQGSNSFVDHSSNTSVINDTDTGTMSDTAADDGNTELSDP